MELSRIQEMCIAKGGSSYVRFRIFQVEIRNSANKRHIKRYELSEQESREFVGILEHFKSLRRHLSETYPKSTS